MNAEARAHVRDLAEDYGWLEGRARERGSDAGDAIGLRFAAALVRNLIGPSVGGHPPEPLHIAIVGGAGSGKSTVANVLCGSVVAEANPQAGFTRHPVAYARSPRLLGIPTEAGFLGPLKLLAAASPSSIDEDFYQVRTVANGSDGQLLEQFVVWDCPDMTTWAARGYAPRLLEVAALADVIVYVASDERYNDAVPTEYLRLLLRAGKPVVIVLTKMKGELADKLIAHFKQEVLDGLPKGRVAIFAIPHLNQDQLSDPVRGAAQHRIPIVNQITVIASEPATLRGAGATAALNFLKSANDELLAVARDDLAALDDWARLVGRSRAEFEDRYQREFLSGAKFYRFDEALVRLIELLELPGVGKFLSAALHVVRTPYRLIKGWLGKMLGTPGAPVIPEQPVLESAFAAWLDQVRATALANEKRHDLWAQVVHGFEGDLGEQLKARFRSGLQAFQAGQREEIDATARAIYEDLERSPGVLNSLRGGKFAVDVAAIVTAVLTGGVGWHDVLLVPLAASMSQQLVEWAGQSYVEAQKDKARWRQREMVGRHISGPVADWLTRWPATGGTSYERLQLALSRIPKSLAAIEAARGSP